MSDIVDRLTYHAFPVADDARELMDEATKEIERLRAELAEEKRVALYHEAEASRYANELATIKGQEPVGILLNREGKVRWNQSIGLRIGAALYAQPVASVADKDAERYRFFIAALSQNEAWAFDLVDLAHKADFDGTIDAAMAKGE